MNLPINSLFASPFAMESAHFAALVEDARGGALDAVAARTRAEFPQSGPPAPPTVALVPIVGPLLRGGGIMDVLAEMFGATTYGAISAAVTQAADAGLPIVLDINSPGGNLDGLVETVDAIRAAKERVPVVAFVRGMGASAAYWIASQADRVIAARGSRVGSVGVMATLYDDAGAQATEGVRRVQIVSSASPDKRTDPLDSEVLARMQRHVDEAAMDFIADVAMGRGVDAEKVAAEFGRGDVVSPARARAAGMIDEVAGFRAAIAAAAEAPRKGARLMTMQAQAPEVPQTATAPDPFRAQVLAALGVDSDGAAIGRIAALVEAGAALSALRADVAQREQAARSVALSAALTSAVSAGNLSLGELSRVVPTLCGAAAGKVREAMAACEKQEAPALVGALVGAGIDAAACEAIGAYLDAKAPPALPVPAVEPARAPVEESKRIDPDRAAMLDRAMNIQPQA